MGRRAHAEEPLGANSCAHTATACWPSISLQWRRSGCNGSTSSSSSSWAAVVYIWPDAHPSERAMGHSVRSATDLGDGVPPGTRSLSDSRSGPEIHRPVSTTCSAVRDRDHSHAVPHPASQWGGRAVRAHRPLGVSRLAAHAEPAHLERVLDVFVTHYNEHRPHRALSLAPPQPRRSSVASRPARFVFTVATVSVV